MNLRWFWDLQARAKQDEALPMLPCCHLGSGLQHQCWQDQPQTPRQNKSARISVSALKLRLATFKRGWEREVHSVNRYWRMESWRIQNNSLQELKTTRRFEKRARCANRRDRCGHLLASDETHKSTLILEETVLAVALRSRAFMEAILLQCLPTTLTVWLASRVNPDGHIPFGQR